MNEPLYTIDQMIGDFGSYRRQVKAILADRRVPTRVVGKRTVVVDQAGYAIVRDALKEYRARPVLARMRRARSTV